MRTYTYIVYPLSYVSYMPAFLWNGGGGGDQGGGGGGGILHCPCMYPGERPGLSRQALRVH